MNNTENGIDDRGWILNKSMVKQTLGFGNLDRERESKQNRKGKDRVIYKKKK